MNCPYGGFCIRQVALLCLQISLVMAQYGMTVGNQASARPDSPVAVRVVTSADSVFASEVADFSFRFMAIDEAGEGHQRELKLGEIEWLQIVAHPEADSISAINELIAGLSSPNYRSREEAETKLSGESGRPEVRALLEKATRHELLEVRFRAERILSTAGSSVKPETERWDYDRVRMKDGSQFRGDAGDFSFRFVSHGESTELSRGELRAILIGPFRDRESAPAVPFRFADVKHEFQDPEFPVWLDFETGVGNRKLLRTANIAREFTDQGLLLRGQVNETDRSGAILVSPYAFNFENKPTGGNSICVSRDPEALRSPHKGITVLSFCLPHQPGVPGGVNRLGMFGARIEYPFSFVLQCFNEDGQLLGEVGSSDDMCSWFELESAEPVVTARFLANPLGLRMELPIDEDYALDNLGMSVPVAAMPLESEAGGMVSLRNGDTIHVSQITTGNDQLSVRERETGRRLQIGLGEINWWIVPGTTLAVPKRGEVRWFAMLDDRSILEVKWNGGDLRPVRKGGLTVERQSLVCLWSGQDWCRFPQATDFDHGQNVLVFPASRLAVADVTLGESGLAWQADGSVAIFQPLKVSSRGTAAEDPTGRNLSVKESLAPSFEQLAWDEATEWNLPTVWFRQPAAIDHSQGSISLNNGEKIVFGPTSRYRLESVSPEGATLADASGTPVFLAWKEIWRVKLPQ